jgi:tetratricopeptide (TPR) repeat protein
MSHEHYQQAISEFEEVVKREPSNAFGYRNLGRASLSAKAYVKAKDAFSRAVELDPTNGDDWASLGDSFIQLGEWRKADNAFNQAVNIAPDNILFLRALLMTHLPLAAQEKDLDTQAQLFSDLLKLAEKTIQVAEKAGDLKLAKEARRTRAEAWNYLAYFYTIRGKALSVAMDYINQALDGWPKDPVFLSTKAEILIKGAEHQAASSAEREATLTQAETLLTSAFNEVIENKLAAELWVDRGRIEILRGHRDAANQDFVKAANLDPTNAEAKRLAD